VRGGFSSMREWVADDALGVIEVGINLDDEEAVSSV
jgi:hypothetical protein